MRKSLLALLAAMTPATTAQAATPTDTLVVAVPLVAWRVGWEIPDLSAETRTAAGESDAAKRRAQYADLQTRVQQDSPYVVMLQGATQVAVRNNLSHVRQGIGVSLLNFEEVQKQGFTSRRVRAWRDAFVFRVNLLRSAAPRLLFFRHILSPESGK